MILFVVSLDVIHFEIPLYVIFVITMVMWSDFIFHFCRACCGIFALSDELSLAPSIGKIIVCHVEKLVLLTLTPTRRGITK